MVIEGQDDGLVSSRGHAKKLRGKGFSWAQIVDVLALHHQASPLRLYRLAHERSASSVVDEFNQLDLAARGTLRVQRLYDYEMWPEGGRRPTARVLLAVARIYQAAARRLVTDSTYASYTPSDQADIDAADFSHFDQYHPRRRSLLYPLEEDPTRPLVPSTASQDEDAALTDDDVFGRFVHSSRGESVELFRAVTRMSSDPQHCETLFQLAAALGGVSGLSLVHKLSPERRERLAQAVLSRRVDAKAVAVFETVTKMSRQLYQARGPEAVLKTVLRFRTVVGTVLGDVPRDTLRERLLRVYADLSQLGGWLLYDLTLYPAADRCFKESLAASQEVRDVRMMAFTHCCLSQMGSFREQIPTAIDHASAARTWAARSGSARLASYVETMAAWAFSLDKDKILTSQALNRADGLLPDQLSGDDPHFVDFVDRSFTVGLRGACWQLLGQLKPALHASEHSVALSNPAFTRNLGFRLVEQVKILVSQKEIEEGAKVAAQVADITVAHHSMRLAQWVGDVRRLMQPWANLPAVRHLDERLMALGLTP